MTRASNRNRQSGLFMENSERTGLLLGLAGVVIFGLTLPATRMALVDLNPWFIVYGRGLVAGIAAAIALTLTGQKLPQRSTWARLAATSAGVVVGFPLFATFAMQYVPASHGGVILAILPLATALAGVLFAGERPSAGFWLCGIAGSLAVLVFALIEGDNNDGVHLADVLLILAVASAAIGYAIGGELSRTMGGWQVICWSLVIAAPILLLLMVLQDTPINWKAAYPAWAGFFYLALFSQFFGFFAWYQGLALGGVAKVGQIQLLQSFITLIASALLLGENITWMQIGFACLVVGIVAIGRRMRVERRP